MTATAMLTKDNTRSTVAIRFSMTGIRSQRGMKIVVSRWDNGQAAGEQARNNAMVRIGEPVYQVGAGRRRNRKVTPPSGEFVRENLGVQASSPGVKAISLIDPATGGFECNCDFLPVTTHPRPGRKTHLPVAVAAGTIVACSKRTTHRSFPRVHSHVTRNRRGSRFPLKLASTSIAQLR